MKKNLFLAVAAALLLGFSACSDVTENNASVPNVKEGGFTFTINSGGGRAPATYAYTPLPGNFIGGRIAGTAEDSIASLTIIAFDASTKAYLKAYTVTTPGLDGYAEVDKTTHTFTISESDITTVFGSSPKVDFYLLANTNLVANEFIGFNTTTVLNLSMPAYNNDTKKTFVMSGIAKDVDITFPGSPNITIARRAARFDIVNATDIEVKKIEITGAYDKAWAFKEDGTSGTPITTPLFTVDGPGKGDASNPNYLNLPKSTASGAFTEHVAPGAFYLNPTLATNGSDMPTIAVTLDDAVATIDGDAWTAANITSIEANKRYKIIVGNGTHKLTIVSEDWQEGGAEVPIKKPDGSIANPYQISSATQLLAFSASFLEPTGPDVDTCKSHYVQTAPIDLNNEEWVPIGKFMRPFAGSYNGQGYTISNFQLSSGAYGSVGFFGSITGGAAISNVHVVGSILAPASGEVGGIVGSATGGSTITNCSFVGNVTGTYSGIGGICGYARDVNITDCYHIGIVTASGVSSAGGILGVSAGTTTVASGYHTGGNVISPGNIGGIVGHGNATITACYWDFGGASTAGVFGNGTDNNDGCPVFGAGAWPSAPYWDADVWNFGSWNGGTNPTYPTLKNEK